MKQLTNYMLPILLLLLTALLAAQPGDDQVSLTRLRTILDRTTGTIELLPDLRDSDLHRNVDLLLHEAEAKYDEAAAALGNGQVVSARASIAQAYGILNQVEILVRTHPVLKFKYREELDRKIQRAEAVVRETENPEAVYLLNRSRRLRERAALMFNQGHTLAAIEFYRLSGSIADQVVKLYGKSDAGSIHQDWRSLVADTRVLLEHSRNLAGKSRQNDQVNTLLNNAESGLREVERLYEADEDNAARRKLVTINRALHRAIDLLESNGDTTDQKLLAEANALHFALESLSTRIENEDGPAVDKLMQRAQNLDKEIRQHIEKNQTGKARSKLKSANQLVRKLNRLTANSKTGREDEVRRRIADATVSLNNIRLQESQWQHADELVAMIERSLGAGSLALDNGDLQGAVQHLYVANRMILQFNTIQFKRANEALKIEQLQTNLQRLESMLARLQGVELNEVRQIRVDSARRLHELALQAYEAENWKICNEFTLSAIELIAK